MKTFSDDERKNRNGERQKINRAEIYAEPVEIYAELVEAKSNRAETKSNRAETDNLCAIKIFVCAVANFLIAFTVLFQGLILLLCVMGLRRCGISALVQLLPPFSFRYKTSAADALC